MFGIDYEGHGRSPGARCYIKRFDNIVNDCSEYFKSICGKLPNFGAIKSLVEEPFLCNHESNRMKLISLEKNG